MPLAALFADLARLFEAQWQGRVRLDMSASDAATASLDRDQITQALLALLHNGAEAALTAAAPPVVRLWATAGPDQLTFHVVDSGPGIDPAHRGTIFLPFFTTKPDGNGIGLTAARQIVQAHGGDATLRSGTPTMFMLSLPQ